MSPPSEKKHYDDDEEEAQEVFTAVPCYHHDHEEIYQEDAPCLEPQDDESAQLSSFKTFSVLLGLLIGCFIQISSLAANYYLGNSSSSITDTVEEEEGGMMMTTTTSTTTAIVFSVIWSFFTSTLGVIIMLSIRSMLLQQKHKIIVECYFAAGALAGVCLAWMGTDIALGMHQHLIHSAFTMFLALLWCKILCQCFPVDTCDDTTTTTTGTTREDQEDCSDSLEELLLVQSSSSFQEDDKTVESILSPCGVKTMGLFLGTLIGLFIQFSSMGANFFVHRLCDNPVVFSLVWSFVTSTMGITVLLFIRILLAISWSGGAGDGKLLQRDHYTLLLHVECFFAIGATLGLNFAWTLTDMALGLESHILQSFFTLLGTLIWCKLVMFCCGYFRTE